MVPDRHVFFTFFFFISERFLLGTSWSRSWWEATEAAGSCILNRQQFSSSVVSFGPSVSLSVEKARESIERSAFGSLCIIKRQQLSAGSCSYNRQFSLYKSNLPSIHDKCIVEKASIYVLLLCQILSLKFGERQPFLQVCCLNDNWKAILEEVSISPLHIASFLCKSDIWLILRKLSIQ